MEASRVSLHSMTLLIFLFGMAHGTIDSTTSTNPFNPYNLTDCRNETALQFSPSGRLRVLSWHIHYTTNSSDQPRFYYAFIKQWKSLFPPNDNKCPFGPNFGLHTYKYVCSLEGAYEEPWAAELAREFERQHGNNTEARRQLSGAGPWSGPQRAFFVPLSQMELVWKWAKENREYVDVLLHPNTGCMHDDHSLRANWILGKRSKKNPSINILAFPCNRPTSGCQDNNFPGPPSCGCKTPLKSDAPQDACKHCKLKYHI